MKNDLISREALKEELSKRLWFVSSPQMEAQAIMDIIDNAPTVYPKHGEWIEIDIKPQPFGAYTCKRKCNKCNYVTSEYRPNFCPNCGAKMKGGAE